jgi:hypothetical protein
VPRPFRSFSFAQEKAGKPWGPIFGLCRRHFYEYRPPIFAAVVPVDTDRLLQDCAVCVGSPEMFPDEGRDFTEYFDMLTRIGTVVASRAR